MIGLYITWLVTWIFGWIGSYGAAGRSMQGLGQ